MLHAALFNLSANSSFLRKSAYSLLGALQTAYDLDMSLPLCFSESLFLPYLPTNFVVSVSSTLSKKHTYLAVEVVTESITTVASAEIQLAQKYLCMMYTKPWISALSSIFQKAKADVNCVPSVEELTSTLNNIFDVRLLFLERFND